MDEIGIVHVFPNRMRLIDGSITGISGKRDQPCRGAIPLKGGIEDTSDGQPATEGHVYVPLIAWSAPRLDVTKVADQPGNTSRVLRNSYVRRHQPHADVTALIGDKIGPHSMW
ncbi:hypothetical protein AB0M12_23310 [Nocardia vinacea]|uniref:hypothetical protein n=1 Tax=Nocardia vinacea TaxID=96468 RepID=UPI003448FDC1